MGMQRVEVEKGISGGLRPQNLRFSDHQQANWVKAKRPFHHVDRRGCPFIISLTPNRIRPQLLESYLEKNNKQIAYRKNQQGFPGHFVKLAVFSAHLK